MRSTDSGISQVHARYQIRNTSSRLSGVAEEVDALCAFRFFSWTEVIQLLICENVIAVPVPLSAHNVCRPWVASVKPRETAAVPREPNT